jgi:XXXCH domain-containing protein
MERRRLLEEKFRPLKKRMQATVKRLKQAAHDGVLPERQDVSELIDQVGMMVSYPGFGDAAYPAFLAATEALGKCCSRRDVDGFTKALATILAQRTKCHASHNRIPPPRAGGG